MNDMLRRLHYSLGPLAAGIILDLLDLATFGPVGLVIGAIVGGWAGWMIGAFEGLARKERQVLAVGAAIYMMIPMTEPVPVATIFTVIVRFFASGSRKRSAAPESGPQPRISPPAPDEGEEQDRQ